MLSASMHVAIKEMLPIELKALGGRVKGWVGGHASSPFEATGTILEVAFSSQLHFI